MIHITHGVEQDLIPDLITLSGYRRARWRAVILYGLAGSGKTATARALADNECIKDAFRAGIAWVDGSRDPENEVTRLCLTLSLERAPGERWLECWRRWAGAGERRFLLIIDDALSAEGLAPLIAGLGPQVVALITTQQGAEVRAEVERWLPADAILEVAVHGLAPAEGRELVEAVIARPLADADWDVVQEIGQLLGWHPEALRLAAIEGREIGCWPGLAGELARGHLSWADLRATLRRQWARLPDDQQAWLTTLLPAVMANGFTPDAAAQAWGETPAVAGRQMWVLAQGGWVEARATQWRMAACARLALGGVVQRQENSAK